MAKRIGEADLAPVVSRIERAFRALEASVKQAEEGLRQLNRIINEDRRSLSGRKDRDHK